MNWTDGPVVFMARERTERRTVDKGITRAVGQQFLFPSLTTAAVDGEDAFGGVDAITCEQGELSAPSPEYFAL